MKNLFLCSFLMVIVACTPRLENDTRLYLEATIMEPDGSRATDVEVVLSNYRIINRLFSRDNAKFSEPDRDFILGRAFTDDEGKIQMTALSATNSLFYLTVYRDDQPLQDYRINKKSFTNLELLIPEVPIKEELDVILVFQSSTGVNNDLDIQIVAESMDCPLLYENGTFQLPSSIENFECNPQFIGVPASENPQQAPVTTLAPSQMEVSIFNGTSTTTSTIQIDANTQTYVINY
ncbi:hypothetical protein [Nonlabens tegetincola]|uniref:hypothetical protein n=1 Tax=Nonlabens tegetincola TaxID=323273 RepID=UPI0030C81980